MAGVRAIHVLWWGLISAVLMVIGSFGPWAKVLGLITVNGTDDGGDGWVVIVAAAVGAVALVLWRVRSRRWLILTVIAAAAGLATTIYDRVDLEGTTNGVDIGSLVDAAWGIYVAMIGSASLALAAIVGWMLTSAPKQTPTPAAAE
jgi:hypothetical protein